jgi:hypothetical protein
MCSWGRTCSWTTSGAVSEQTSVESGFAAPGVSVCTGGWAMVLREERRTRENGVNRPMTRPRKPQLTLEEVLDTVSEAVAGRGVVGGGVVDGRHFDCLFGGWKF